MGLLSAVAMPFSLSAYAQANDGFDGFYVGGSLGGTSTNVNQDKIVESDYDALPNGFDNFFEHEAGPISLKTDTSFKGALYAGYGQCWDYWYLGAEIFVDLAHYKNRNAVEVDETVGEPAVIFADEFQADTHTKLNNFQFGIDLRSGILLTPTSMLYGRVGVAFSDLDLNSNAVFAGNSATIPENFAILFPLSTSKDVTALRLGGGLEQHMSPNLNVRLDYIYTYYGRASVTGVTTQVLPQTGEDPGADIVTLNSSTNVKIFNNTVMLGLTYLIK